MHEAKQILTTGDIAKYCGVNFRTVIRWVKQGHIKAYQLPGERGDNRIEVPDFIEFLKKYNMSIPEEFRPQSASSVLVVDDDANMAKSIQRVLQGAGLTTAIAYDGFRAGAMLGVLRPALVTLDIQMPGLSGLDVIAYMRSQPELKATRILVISGTGDDLLRKAVKEGADDYLAKPFRGDELLAKVNRLLGRETPARPRAVG